MEIAMLWVELAQFVAFAFIVAVLIAIANVLTRIAEVMEEDSGLAALREPEEKPKPRRRSMQMGIQKHGE